MTEWVELRPIFEVFAKETEYKGGWRVREQWWHQTAAERQMKTTLKYISAAVWEKRRWESGRCGNGE